METGGIENATSFLTKAITRRGCGMHTLSLIKIMNTECEVEEGKIISMFRFIIIIQVVMCIESSVLI